MAQQASDDWLTTALQRSGLNLHPLGMGCRHVVRKPADLAFYFVHQPADTILWCMTINKWLVLVWHDARLARGEFAGLIEITPFWVNPLAPGATAFTAPTKQVRKPSYTGSTTSQTN